MTLRAISAGWLSVSFIASFAACGVAAPPEGGRALAHPVAGLIERLGDTNFRAREQAGRSLLRLGVTALPALRSAASHQDFEVRRRADALRVQVERAEVIRPTLVSLPKQPISVSQAFKQLERQTGYRIESVAAAEDELYLFSVQKLTFWEALDQIGWATGLAPWSIDDGTIHLVKRPVSSALVVRQGAFRIAADHLQETRTVSFAESSSSATHSETLDFVVTVHSEPRLALLEIGTPFIAVAEDDRGRSMATDAPAGNHRHTAINGSPNKCYRLTAKLPIRRSSPDARRIRLLRGTIPVSVLQADLPETTVPDVRRAAGTTVETSSGRMTLDEITRMPDQGPNVYSMRISFRRPMGMPANRQWSATLDQRLVLEAANGERWTTQDVEWLRRGADDVELRLTAESPKAEPPERLVLTSWTCFDHPVEFEFRDVPLP